MKKTNAGFSLVELMVVVAIIGILATIAIPNFTKFQAKAKQSSAKIELTGLYTAEKSFFTEYSEYHDNLPFIGFVPEGFAITAGTGCPVATSTIQRNYIVGFSGAVITGETTPVGVTNNCTGTGASLNYYASTVATVGTGQLPTTSGTDNATGYVFKAAAAGQISSGTKFDTWTIDQDKTITNVSVGY